MSLKSFLSKSLKRLDFFGVPIRFTLNDQTLHKSPFGGLLSLILFLIFLVILQQCFFSLIYRQEITTYTQETISQDPPAINLESIPLNLAMSFSDTRMNQGTYFNVEIYQVFSIFSAQNNHIYRNKTLLPMEKCTQDNFREDLQKAFLTLDNSTNILTYFCPQKGQLFYAQGSFVYPDFTYFEIIVSACINSSSITCVSQDQIDGIFLENDNKIYLNFYLSNNIINPQDFDNPVSSFFDDSLYVLLDRANYKEKNFYFTQNKIMTDRDYIQTDFKEEFNTYAYENLYDENTVALEQISNTTIYAAAFFRADSISKTQYRYSEKLGKYVSYIGGFWSILHFLLGLIGEGFNNRRIKTKLANALYDFKDGVEKNDKKKLTFPAKIQKNNLLNDAKGIATLKDNLEEKLRRFLTARKEWKLPYEETFIWRKFFIRSKEKQESIKIIGKLREKANTAIDKDLDIVHLLRKVKSSDKLRNLLLNNDQNFVFEFFHKTEINYLNDAHFQSRLSRFYNMARTSNLVKMKINAEMGYKEQKLTDLIKLYKSYESLKGDNEDKLNKRIIKEIRPEILTIFTREEESKREIVAKSSYG